MSFRYTMYFLNKKGVLQAKYLDSAKTWKEAKATALKSIDLVYPHAHTIILVDNPEFMPVDMAIDILNKIDNKRYMFSFDIGEWKTV